MMKFVHIGYNTLVNQLRIVAVEPIRSNLTEREQKVIFANRGLLLDMTHKRKIRSVIVLDTGHRILSAASPEEIKWRMMH